MTNLEEYIAGTNPTNHLSRFEISEIRSGEYGSALRFSTVAERWYAVEYKDDLADPETDWTALTNAVPGDGSVFEFEDTSAVTQRFYRIRVRL